MSLQTDGVWKGAVWASTVWEQDVWFEGAQPVAGKKTYPSSSRMSRKYQRTTSIGNRPRRGTI